jgi:hypothetical protein
MAPPRSCAILIPVGNRVEPDCERALRELERRGYPVIRGRGSAQIDFLRSQMATDFLREGFEETMWIDSDTGFQADDVERLRSHNLPICAGICAQKGRLALAAKTMPGTSSITFGQAGGLVELLYAGTGFLHVRKEVYTAIQEKCRLPECNVSTGRPIIPFFLPLVAPIDGEPFYLSEDYSFCERARQSGFKIMADSTIRLWHIGTYRYGWEDAARAPMRHDSFVFPVSPASQGRPTDRPT